VSRDASFAALLSLSEKLFNRHCAFFRLHGIPIVAASPSAGVSAGGAGGAAAAAALLAAEPWRNTLAVGDSVDYYVERAAAWVSAWLNQAIPGGQICVAYQLLTAVPTIAWIQRGAS
jgi:hypothetical protein